MAFCRFCGKEIPEGGSCDCPESMAQQSNQNTIQETLKADAASQQNSVNLSKESAAGNTASEPNFQQSGANPQQPSGGSAQQSPFAQATDMAAAIVGSTDPKKLKKIAAGIVAALVLLVLLFSGPSYKSTSKKFFKAMYNKHGGKTICTLALPDDAIKAMKKDDEWDEAIEDFNDGIEDEMDEWDKKPKFKKISKTEKMKNSELRDAEDYFYMIASESGADVDEKDFKAKKGYKVTIKYKDTEGDNDKITLNVVKLKGEGWKVMFGGLGGLF